MHEIFRAFPAGFIPVAIARNITGAGALTFGDGSSGVPYILATGGGIVPVGSTAQNIPTMTEWGMVLMAALIALSAMFFLRRRGR